MLYAFKPVSLCYPGCRQHTPSQHTPSHARVFTPCAGELLRLLNSLRDSKNEADIKMAYDNHGINKLFYALEQYPHLQLLDLPFDGLHLFPDGLLRSEGAWLFYVLIKMKLDINKVTERVKACTRACPAMFAFLPCIVSSRTGRREGRPDPLPCFE